MGISIFRFCSQKGSIWRDILLIVIFHNECLEVNQHLCNAIATYLQDFLREHAGELDQQHRLVSVSTITKGCDQHGFPAAHGRTRFIHDG